MESPKNSEFTLAEQFEDTLNILKDIRNTHVEQIKTFLSSSTKSEVSKMQKLTYKDSNTKVPEVKLNFKDVPHYVDDEKSILPSNNTNECVSNNLKEEIRQLKKFVQVLKNEVYN